jgi:hypothetical protein
LWLERVDAAEIRAERVEQRLDQLLEPLLQQRPAPAGRSEPPPAAPAPAAPAREPWWRRWFGASKRSKLGTRAGPPHQEDGPQRDGS